MKLKTIDQCRLEIAAHTFDVGVDENGDWIGDSDWLPVRAARASFGAEDKTGDNIKADRKLLAFLAENKHVSVFEHNYVTFLIECPLFIRSQIMRHRSFSFNEISRRYTSEEIEFWIPDKWRKQAKNNKQCSTDEEVDSQVACYIDYTDSVQHARNLCESLLEHGVAREQARAVLPQSLLTRFYMTGNLRSWWSFLTQRCDEHSQYEMRVVANKIKDKLTNLWPESMGVLFPDG